MNVDSNQFRSIYISFNSYSSRSPCEPDDTGLYFFGTMQKTLDWKSPCTRREAS